MNNIDLNNEWAFEAQRYEEAVAEGGAALHILTITKAAEAAVWSFGCAVNYYVVEEALRTGHVPVLHDQQS